MAIRIQNVIVPEIFDPYVIEQSTFKNAFVNSGVVQTVPSLESASEGGDFVNVPFWVANLSGELEVLTDSTSLTPGELTGANQKGVVLHRGRAWASRDLAAMAAGSDPMMAIADKISDYYANQQQKELLAILSGVFGSLASATGALAGLAYVPGTITALTPGTVAKMRSLLGDQGDKLAAIAMHSASYYDLVERKLVDFVKTGDALAVPATTNLAGGSGTMAAYGGAGTADVPFFCGLRVIIDDDVTKESNNYAVYGFVQGAIGMGEQQAFRTETDRDILAKEDAMSIDAHWIYHPMGCSYSGSANPSRAALATVGNWTQVYQTKNIGIVRATVVSNF